MSLFNNYTLTVKRKSPGSYIDGMWINGFETTFEIQTSWQPANAKDMEILEEGKRQSAIFKIYPAVELYIVDPITKRVSDIIVGPDGYDYEVISVAPYQNNILSHYKVLVIRIKENRIEDEIF